MELVDEFVEAEQLADRAITLACELNHPVYDAVYLVACQNWHAALLALDAKLALAAVKIGVQVIDVVGAEAATTRQACASLDFRGDGGRVSEYPFNAHARTAVDRRLAGCWRGVRASSSRCTTPIGKSRFSANCSQIAGTWRPPLRITLSREPGGARVWPKKQEGNG